MPLCTLRCVSKGGRLSNGWLKMLSESINLNRGEKQGDGQEGDQKICQPIEISEILEENLKDG